MVRRGLVCNLEALDERPELKKYNRNTLRQAAANRATYVAAGLTIMRAYLAAGAPEVCGPLGSYAEWSTMVRSSLVWLGEPDPVASVDATQAEDPELADLRELFDRCLGEYLPDTIYGVATFVEAANAAPVGFNPNPWRELLLRIAADKDGDISTRRLGDWLHRNSGRVVRVIDGRRFRLVRQPHLRDGRAQYRLVEVT
jgi:putative DNA primase/helicase